jgi:hypothetical protein
MSRLVIAPDVAWIDARDLPALGEQAAADAVYVTRVPDGVPLVLEGSAWAVWTALADGADTVAAVAEAAAALMGTEPGDAVARDVTAFLDQLTGAGLVVPAPR